jgi:hypothetical protein
MSNLKIRIMKTLKRLVPFIALVVGTSCSTVKVVTDHDKNADFTKYQTYSFLGWQDGTDALLNEFDKKRLRDAFKAEFDARGLKYVETGGDMDISLYIVLNQKTSISAYTDYYGSLGYGYYRYGGWGMGHARTTYTEYEYTEGTLVMDVFDSGTKNQIWQAVATGTVEENPARRDKTIPKSVNALMSKFPVVPAI